MQAVCSLLRPGRANDSAVELVDAPAALAPVSEAELGSTGTRPLYFLPRTFMMYMHTPVLHSQMRPGSGGVALHGYFVGGRHPEWKSQDR